MLDRETLRPALREYQATLTAEKPAAIPATLAAAQAELADAAL